MTRPGGISRPSGVPEPGTYCPRCQRIREGPNAGRIETKLCNRCGEADMKQLVIKRGNRLRDFKDEEPQRVREIVRSAIQEMAKCKC